MIAPPVAPAPTETCFVNNLMTMRSIDPVETADFIVSRLQKPLRLAGADCLAVSETEQPLGGDIWYWTDDNAKVVEFLARPEICRLYERQTDEIFRFLRLMCRGPFLFRRVSAPRLALTRQEGSETSFDHSVMSVRCDLGRGAVVAGIRFHDGRTADNLLMWTNRVDFTYRGRKYSLPVERVIDQTDSLMSGDRLELRFAGDLAFKPRSREIRVGRISYAYTLDAHSMVIGVEVALEVDVGADIDDVVLSITHDHLSHDVNHVHYSTVLATVPGQKPLRFDAGESGRHILAVAGADYYSFVQSRVSRIAGFALAAHSVPRRPESLAEIEVEVREPGRLHLARSRYRFGGSCRGCHLVAGEDKMLTAGGFYDQVPEYRGLLHDAIAKRSDGGAVVDFSASYDYGAELAAFAQYFEALVNRIPRATSASDEAKSLFDFYLDAYFRLFVADHHRRENTIFVRQLAFVVISLVTMLRATGTVLYRQRLIELCDVLLEFEVRFDDIAGNPASGFVLGVQRGTRIVYADCHSAALLALTEASAYVDDPRLAAAVDRGLASYGIETARVDFGDRAHVFDLVGVHWSDDNGLRQRSNAFWNFHAGLTLRFFGALRRTAHPALRAVMARHRERIALLEFLLRRQIERSLTWHPDAVEIRTSMLSGETNSETQPWVALGMLECGMAGD